MIDILKEICIDLDLNKSINEDLLNQVETQLNCIFPKEYKDLMLQTNGLYGETEDNILGLFPIEELIEVQEDYNVKELDPSLIIIGSDYCGNGYAFNKDNNMSILRVDWICIGNKNDYQDEYYSFTEFIKNL